MNNKSYVWKWDIHKAFARHQTYIGKRRRNVNWFLKTFSLFMPRKNEYIYMGFFFVLVLLSELFFLESIVSFVGILIVSSVCNSLIFGCGIKVWDSQIISLFRSQKLFWISYFVVTWKQPRILSIFVISCTNFYFLVLISFSRIINRVD